MMTTVDVPRLATLGARLAAFGADIKLSHTVFAMPFALLAAFLAAGGVPAWGQVGLVVACMVLARSFAMGMNRLLDADLDRLNPRTARRAIPAGTLSRPFVAIVIAACGLAFIATTAGFLLYDNRLPLLLSVPALALVGAYPYLKRFTRLCHYYLGAALGLAPLCAWVAIAGTVAPTPLLLGLAVLCWTAGFDVLYATQDVASDRATGVHSVPAAVGVRRALWVARLTHAAAVALLVGVGLASPYLGPVWYGAVACVVALLVCEHALVRPDDLSKLNLAFFTLNGAVALCLGTLGVADVLAG